MCNCNCSCGSGGCCSVAMTAKVLVIIGGVNWGLVGLGMLLSSDLNVVHMLLGAVPTLEAIVYVLVGLAAVMKIFGCKCKTCMAGCANCTCGADGKTGGHM